MQTYPKLPPDNWEQQQPRIHWAHSAHNKPPFYHEKELLFARCANAPFATPSCSWAISTGHPTPASKTDSSKAEKRFASPTEISPLPKPLTRTYAEPATWLQYQTSCTPNIKKPKASITNRQSHQLTNTALGLFPQLKQDSVGSLPVKPSTPISGVSRHRDSQEQLFRCTVFISYRVHNKLLSTCNIPKKVTHNVKKYSIFCSFFVFKFFLYIF